MLKKLLTSTLLSCFVFCASGQITYEATYPTGAAFVDELNIVKLTSSGYKYVVSDTNNVKIYNLNHSIFQIIPIPYNGPYGSIYAVSVFYVSEELFNTNPADIEFLLLFRTSSNSIQHIYVFDEFGNILFAKDSVGLGGYSGIEQNAIVYTTGGVKLLLSRQAGQGSQAYVYSLPGILPCNDCTNGVITGLANDDGNQINKLPNPYPNPTDNSTTIPYTLPEGESTGEIVFYDAAGKEIKRFKVDKTFSQIIISSADLAPGTLYYHLQTAKNTSEGKTLVVIK